MKIHLLIRDLGGGQPVINVNGTTGQIFAFIWDRPRCAHVKSWEVGDEAGLKKFRRESAEILNQRLMWPVFVDVDLADPAAGDVALRAANEALNTAVGELKAENAALRASLSGVSAEPAAPEPTLTVVPDVVPELSRQQKAALTRMANKGK